MAVWYRLTMAIGSAAVGLSLVADLRLARWRTLVADAAFVAGAAAAWLPGRHGFMESAGFSVYLVAALSAVALALMGDPNDANVTDPA